jgi:beta-lactamase superfamily II metal-dependent hydrolase
LRCNQKAEQHPVYSLAGPERVSSQSALDLKSGGALHIRTPESDWLCDTGSLRDYDRVVRQYLRSRGVNRLDGLILTHGDAGHIGGGCGVLLLWTRER